MTFDDPFRTARLVLALRQAGVVDQRVLEVMEQTPRERFVPRPFHESAWDDVDLPIDCGQTLTSPVMVGVMLQALRVQPGQRVLEVGTGSGYGAALLTALGASVVSIERYRTLLDKALINLAQAGVADVDMRLGDGLEGAPDAAPFDRMVLWGAIKSLSGRLASQLAPDGVVVAPMERAGQGEKRQMIVALERLPADHPSGGGWRETPAGLSALTPLQHGVAREL